MLYSVGVQVPPSAPTNIISEKNMKKFWNWLMNVKISDIVAAPFLVLMGIVLIPIIIIALMWDNIWWKIGDIKKKREKNEKMDI